MMIEKISDTEALKNNLYSAINIDTFYKYCREKYPHVNMRRILKSAGIEEYEIADPGHWFSDEQVDRFYNLLVESTGNENLAREVGRYAASPGTMGVIRQYTLGLIGPARAFQIIERAARKISRAARYKSRKLSHNSVEIIVTPVKGILEKEYVCQNRQGLFEAIVTAFGLPIPDIKHQECLFDGGEMCRYVITWENNLAWFFKRTRDWAIAVTIGFSMVAAFVMPAQLIWVMPVMTLLVLGLWVAYEHLHNKSMQSSIDSLWNSTDQLTEQISINYRNAQLSQEVGEVISSKTTIDDVIASVIKILQERLDFDRGVVLLADEERKRLDIRGAFGYNESQIDILETTSFRLNNPNSKGVFTFAFHNKRPYLVNDVEEIAHNLTKKSLDFIQNLGIQSFIAVPIILENEALGILAVDNRRTKKPLMRSDMNMLMGVAPAMGVAIQNAQLLEEQQAQFEATLKILADSIDARDFMTAGHSEQVSEYASGIAEELGQELEYIQMIKIAALLHDYGKIGVPDSILKKDGPLTTEEMAMIRTHPAKTGQILEGVPFKGIYAEIPAICAAHHEKWDGSGYPNAIRGNDIPLGARIIAVADFFEAITSKRHYREPLLMDVAVAMLMEESGKHFEPRIVQAFLRYLRKTHICLIDEEEADPFMKGRVNNRAYYRTQVSAEIGKKIVAGTSVDISEGGIFIRSPDVVNLEKGNNVTLTLSLPAPDELVRIIGRIAWVNTGEPLLSEKYPPGFGVEFKNTHGELKRQIASYSEKIKQMESRKIILPKNPHETLH